MATGLKPGDRVTHSDGRIGTVVAASMTIGSQVVKWDGERYRETVRNDMLHLIRKPGDK